MARNTSSVPRPRSRRDRSSPWWPALCSCAHRNHQLQNIGRLIPQNKQRNTGGPLARNTTPTIGPWPGFGSCALGHNTGEPLLDRKIHDLIANVRSGPSRSRFNQRQLERRRADWSQSSWRKPSRSRLNQCQLERCKSDWCQLERCRFDGFLLAWR